MTTILEALQGINAYPIPFRTLAECAEARGLSLNDIATQEVLSGRDYNLAKADLLLWLSDAPNVSQGGQSYTFSDEQRTQLRSRAKSLYAQHDDPSATKSMPTYGYKGESL
ncbi:MAG: hypothetical protein MJY71_02460 [Bacteroidaceae bacterium]|nr:hypothetical protein [Bacteroidaceae bacterium]